MDLTKVCYFTFWVLQNHYGNDQFRYLFHDRGLYDIETSSWIYSASQWTDSDIIGTSVTKKLKGCVNICFEEIWPCKANVLDRGSTLGNCPYTKCPWLTLAWEIRFYCNVLVHIKKTQKEVTIKSLPQTYQDKRELIILNTMFPSHGNQSDNFQNKSIDLFLYYGNFDHKWPSQLCFNFLDLA